MTTIKNICSIVLCFAFASTAFAHINPNRGNNPVKGENPNLNTPIDLRMEDCTSPTAQIDMEINNVRARLTTGGDVWWDPNAGLGRYVVPAVPVGSGLRETSSIFAAAVWLGGFDPSGNLKMAATDYRTNGQDFYTGPLLEETGLTDLPICQRWDRFFEVDGDEVRKAIRDFDISQVSGQAYDVESVPADVRYWPGVGNPYFFEEYGFDLPNTSSGLGSFWDEDLSGDYDPTQGDFPIIDIRGCEPDTRKEAIELVPDQMFFWIYNDAGGPHTLTMGTAINMEVQVQAFAYGTNDEINDMTFQRYKLINRATTDITQTYFGWWVDPDLGCHVDDYSGCDVERSLAYTYNDDAVDGDPDGSCECPNNTATYCNEVPIIGTDYFRGPLGPKRFCAGGDLHIIGIADDFYDEDIYSVGDSVFLCDYDPLDTEEPDISIQLGMSSFITYNNPGIGDPPAATADPSIAPEYYNYLTGVWRDGTALTVGGTGYNPGSIETTRYAFSDPPNQVDGWSMADVSLGFGDRRTVQSSGPFLLRPGDRNELIVGAVWVPDIAHPRPSISRLQTADDIAQNLFDACFDIIDGPDAPDVSIIELDREIILVLSNDTIESNNAFEAYSELDILSGDSGVDEEERFYKFEGYKIYQLADASVSPQQLDNSDDAMLIGQVDINNEAGELFNWSSTEDPNPLSQDRVWAATRKVDGSNTGIRRTFKVTTDAYATSDDRLVNHKNYYFMAVAYAYNDFATFSQSNPTETQQRPYLEGRGNIMTYKATPRPIVYQGLNSGYGEGVAITRISGVGVGGNNLDMEDGMADQILEGGFDGRITYKPGAGPIEVQIYNPLEVKDGRFQLEMVGTHNSLSSVCALEEGVSWVLRDLDTGFEVASDGSIDALNEQLIPEYGFSISIGQSVDAGFGGPNNGAIDARLDYADADRDQWYAGLRDDGAGIEGLGFLRSVFNFLKTGSSEADAQYDPSANYSSVGDGFFYPFPLTSGARNDEADAFGGFYLTPAWKVNGAHAFIRNQGLNIGADRIGVQSMNNVDIIFTSEKSKWSRCVVVESASEDFIAEADPIGPSGTDMFDLRQSESIDENGNPLGDGTIGFSYFPGYAIDVETGKRVNIFFGENSTFLDADGNPLADMIFNPTDALLADDDLDQLADFFVGGQHYIYVTNDEYDGCQRIHDKIGGDVNGNLIDKVEMLLGITWTSMCYLQEGTSLLSIEEGIIPNELTVKLRVENPYNLETNFNLLNTGSCNVTNGEFPLYEFEISGKEAVDITQENYNGELDKVNVVPNPYYAYSAYEINQNATTIKVTNLPDEAIVTIYSLDGKFIKQFKRSESITRNAGANRGVENSQTNPAVEWDLKNSAGIPVASGVYLFHITAPELGEERTIKWFGVNRKFDPSGL